MIRGISLERLMRALTAPGQSVEIIVTPSKKKSAARIPSRLDNTSHHCLGTG
jgi:hypothetical protein